MSAFIGFDGRLVRPILQCFLNYLLVALFHGGLLVRDGYRTKQLRLSLPFHRYAVRQGRDRCSDMTARQPYMAPPRR